MYHVLKTFSTEIKKKKKLTKIDIFSEWLKSIGLIFG